MDWLQVLVLSVIQGVTEFLPISSSAHLILPAQLLGWVDQGLAFDVAVHFGSLMAIVFYFRHDLRQLAQALFASKLGRDYDAGDARLAHLVIYATLPAVAVGLVVNGYSDYLRSTLLIATTTIVFGILLAVADRKPGHAGLPALTLGQALIIGVMQCLALIPGTSRSGITMTAGLLLGLSREASARFSFLLSVPLIAAASLLKSIELVLADEPVALAMLLAGVGLSAVSAYACIRLFLQLIERIGFMPFVIYRLLLGGTLLWFVLQGA